MYCRRCGAALHQGVVICPECGARQRRGISSVRCARCGHHVALGLTVCPHCGRDVHPAGPRWGWWFLGLAIIVLAAFWGLGELPVDRITTGVASMQARVGRVVQFLGPATAPGGAATPTPEPTRATAQAVAALPHTPMLVTEPTESIEERSETPLPTATVELASTVATPVVEVTPTAEPSATQLPTQTPTPEPTATPTQAPTATPTAIPTEAPKQTGIVTYKVVSGDTLSGIATKFDISWQALADANKLNSRSTLRIGQELVVPGASPAAGNHASTPASSTAPQKYTVKSGDSLATIAAQYGITYQELAAANGLTTSTRLRIGQELVIPGKGAAAQPVLTATPSAPPTARPATPTNAPAAELLPVPALISPGDQTPFSGSTAFLELVWSKVDGLPTGGGYRVSIRWTEQGAPMEYLVPLTTATSIRMPSWLFGKADQPARQYSWSVRVVRPTTDGQGGEKDVLLSPSSATRVFYWN